MYPQGTIISCPQCGEGLYKVQRRTTTKELVLESARLLAPLNPTIPRLDAWQAFFCPRCGGRLFKDGQLHTLQDGWR